jgi:mannose PTS system EIIA component
MVGIVVAAHGRLAEELVATAEQIVGPVPAVTAIRVEPGASPEEIRGALKAAVAQVDDGSGVLVFADLVGGSPCTQSLTLCAQASLEVVTGVNLPMLLKANSLRSSVPTLRELAHQLTAYGQKHITCATDVFRANIAAAKASAA